MAKLMEAIDKLVVLSTNKKHFSDGEDFRLVEPRVWKQEHNKCKVMYN